MWIHFFEWLGRFCYDAADPIIALYEQNRLRQVADGALPERTINIPNGVNLNRLRPLRAARQDTVPPVLCLIGRVVPIKDIKTFIRAFRALQIGDAEASPRQRRGRSPGGAPGRQEDKQVRRIVLGPFNRVEGDLEISLDVDAGQVFAACSSSSRVAQSGGKM